MISKPLDSARTAVGVLLLAAGWLAMPVALQASIDARATTAEASQHAVDGSEPARVPALLSDEGSLEPVPDSSGPKLQGAGETVVGRHASGAPAGVRPQDTHGLWVSQHIHLRRSGHLSLELDLPPPLLS